MNISDKLSRYREIFLYILFGVLTTLVNIISYWVWAHLFYVDLVVSTVLAWILSVLFAYITNKLWVFNSKTTEIMSVLIEIGSFFACRLLTGVIDVVGMYVFAEILEFNDICIKIVVNIIVIVLNYIASKQVIFRKTK